MGVFSLFIILLLIFCESDSLSEPYKGPHITVRDGHLIIAACPSKNITFQTTAGIAINDVDLLSTLNKAHDATKLLQTYQNSFSSYVDRISSLEQRINDQPISLSNTSAPSGIAITYITRLNRRMTTLQRRLQKLRDMLSSNDCASNPCKNGGVCYNMYNGHTCTCLDGWEGVDCTHDINECSRFAGTNLGCQNGATCVNKPGTYECECASGYVGEHCTRKTADCSVGGTDLCGHGTCVPQSPAPGYKCICDQGWTTDGINPACSLDVNECNLNHPACSTSPRVPCINVPGSYYCGACPQGYTGNGYYCADVDECAMFNGGCSMNPMVTCINTHGSYVCGACPPGYYGNGKTCSFQGVCNVDNGGCHHLAQCRDNPRISSTYVECICPAGYVGNGIGQNGCAHSTSPFNPCSSHPCVNGVCSVNNVTGDYICNCRRKYTGRNCDIIKDPCASNPCLNGGTCQNLINLSFKCNCASGYTGSRCESQIQGCGGKLREENGTLKYPPGDYETYDNRLSCAWTIETNSTKVLKIVFKKFDIEKSTGCRYDWLQIHDGANSASRSLGRFCGDDLPLGGKIVSTHNIIYMWFRSDGRTVKGGFELTWNSTDPACGGVIITSSHGSIESPGSPGVYPPNRDCYWSLLAPINKRLLFHFYSLKIGENSGCDNDYMEFSTKLNDRDNMIFARFCNTSTPSPFYSPGATAVVYFHSDNHDSFPGFQLTYSVVEGIPGCGGTYTSESGTIQSVQPQTALNTYICEYKIQQPLKTKVRITFLSLDVRTTPGCKLDYVEIREGPDTNSPLVGRYCGPNLPTSYTSPSNEITILSSTSKDTGGWKLTYNKVCGSIFTNISGSFEAKASRSTIDCIYQIVRPLGYVIELALKVSIQHSCALSGLEVRDGDNENSTLLVKYCGNKNEIITSTHNHLWIRYTYKPSIFSWGNLASSFEATYTSTDIGCGGILRDKLGNIASPVHPEGYYPPQLKCTWVIIAPPGNIIQLTWVTFNLEQSYECTYDNVRVFDNNTDLGLGGLMGRYCGFTLPPTLQTSSNIMTVVFNTDITINMDGFVASYAFIPEENVCGGNYFTSAGVLKSPRYPEDYPVNKACTWTITVPSGQQIMLNVTDFNIEQYQDCKYDLLEIRNGGTSASPIIGKYCGTTIPRLIPSHTNKLFLFFKSDMSRTGHGFKITWSSTATGCGGKLTSPRGSIISPHYPEPYNRNTECTWIITVSAGSLIQVVFSDIDMESHSHCLADYVEIFDGLTTNSKSLGKFCTSEAGRLINSTGNQILVKFRSDVAIQKRGFQLHYSTLCHNTLKGFRGIIESPNFPNEYPQDSDCLWTITVSDKNKINVTFSHFELERSLTYANKSCTFDYVEIKYAERHDETFEETDLLYVTQGKYCGANNPGQISLNSDHVQIHFVSDKLLIGSGFRLEWQIFGCGGTLTHNSGTIQSPNYPKPYPPLVKCEWKIEVEYGNSIEIQFAEVDIERDTTCEYDWIKVYNGPDNTYNLLTKICRQKKAIQVSSTGNFMFIEFKSDYSYQGRGFIANYSTTSAKCGGHLTAPDGSIFSPNYPKNYNRNDTCEWLVDVDENHSVDLDFEDLDLLKSDTCEKNYVKICDGPTAAYPVLEKVCGEDKPNTTHSQFNEMYVEFRAHPFSTTKGFLAKYRKSCGSRISTQGSGIIEIHHDEFSGHITTCTWTIVSTDPSRHITLIITHMQTQTYYCDGGVPPVKIFSGESTESPLLNSYCGVKVPPPLISDGSAITIYLETEMDFSATYSVLDSHCGGTYTSSEGFFATPGYPKMYASNVQCEWIINVAPGNHITLSFIYFELLQSDKCNTDFLEIRKNNSSGTALGVYCGTNKPVNITHEGSLWLMYKGSQLDPSDTSITAKGFHAEYALNDFNELSGPKGVIASPMYPLMFNNYGSFSWKIKVATRMRIVLTFKEFYVETESFSDSDCYFANFEVYDGVDDTAPLLKSLCGLDIPDPIKSSSNVVFIKLHYYSIRMGTKFLMEWLEVAGEVPGVTVAPPTEGCGSSEVLDINALHNYTILTSPGYPGGYKPDLNCEWIFSTIPMNHLKLYFTDVDLKNYMFSSREPTCQADYVALYQKHSYDNDWQLLKTVCSAEDHSGFIYSTDLLKVKFVSNRYFNGTGFKAYIYEACGGSMTGTTGHIIYNNSTIRAFECQWNITARSGRTIELTFEEMNIAHEENKGCDNYLMIRNGKYPDSPLLGNGKYCGTELPGPLKSTGNYVYIKYRGSPNVGGFKIKYQEVSFACGKEITLDQYDNNIEISSPNYPNIPVPHSECTWLIRAPPDESLRIDFEDRFDLTFTPSCTTEYVEIRDGGTEYSPLIGRYCKKAPPSTQISTDNMMFVKFFTDTDEPKNGFKAKISLAYCGGTIRGQEGVIKAPSIRAPSKNINCTWHIVGPLDHYLNVKFTKLQITKGLRCLPSHVVTISEESATSNKVNQLKEYCGTLTIPPPLTTSSNEAIVKYIGDSNDNFVLKFNASQSECGGNFNVESGVIQSPNYPIMNHVKRNCKWLIEVAEGRRITLTIEDMDLEQHYQGVAIYDDHRKYMMRRVQLRSENQNSYESSSNKMTVMFWSTQRSNRRGFKASFTSNKPTICTGNFIRNSGVITQPAARNTSYWCHWTRFNNRVPLDQTFALKIDVHTNVTSKQSRISNCRYSMWSVVVMNEDDKNVISRICGASSQNNIVRSPFQITQMEAFVAGAYQMNFTASFSVHDCGGILGEQQGVISSPNFPSKPSTSVECAWLIKVGKEQIVNLTTVSINLGSDCEKNFLSVYNGDMPTHPRIGKYCQGNTPDAIVSQSNSLWIEYKWETGSSGSGFKFKYEATSGGCGGIYHDKTRTIQTPNYGKDYPNNAECLWEIRSNSGYVVRLQFIERFQLEDSNNCKNDYIEIFDWKDDKWVSLGKKCGRNTPDAIQSTSDKLKLLFRSNNNITASGFKAKWDWHCGGTFKASKTPRYIVSPGYPGAYTTNLNCVYNISTNAEVLSIRFDDFEIEGAPSNCIYDNVTINGKYFVTYAFSNRVYCGTNKPPFMRLRGNTIITFKTDHYVNNRGFKFMYSDESCGGDITTATVIESPPGNVARSGDYGYFHPRIKCVWKITAPSNQIAILRVISLKMVTSPMCFAQSVELYNGLQENQNRLIAMCGDVIEGQPIPAESGKMMVKLDASPVNYGGFKAEVYFSHGPAEGCGGFINLTETKYIQSPNLEDLDCTWTIVAPRDYQVQIQFTEFNIPGSCTRMANVSYVYCSCSFIEIRDGAQPMSDLIEKLCSGAVLDNRKFITSLNSGYIRFFLMGRKDNVFKATLTPVLSKCGPSILNVTNEIKTITSPNYPNKYPPGIKCSWVFSVSNMYDKMAVHFVEFDLTEDGSDRITSNACSGDKVVIIEDPNSRIISEGLGPNAVYQGKRNKVLMNYNDVLARHVFCGKGENPFDYYSTGKSFTLLFNSINSQDKGKGFKLEYSIASCNRNYTAVQGRIFNGNYKSDCIITVTVPENRTISLYFQQLYIPYSQNCSDVSFVIKDNGPTGKELVRTCGYRTPNPVFSNTNKVYIHFHYKNNVPSYLTRYDFAYTSTEYGRGCGGELYNYKGKFSSPFYPNEYRNDSVCTWNVRVPTGLHVALKFTNFDIQGNCDQTYLTVTTYSNEVASDHVFCKSDRPAVMRSDSHIDVTYTSSIHNGGTGWLAVYQGVTEDATDIS